MSNALEKFSAGEQFAVDPDSIERELAAIWRNAGQSTDAGQPVTRACLWNVVVHVEERAGREGTGYAATLVEMINRMPEHLAARGLVLHTRDGEPKLDAWISANCILSGDGGKLVCSEEITLAATGDRDNALPSLVRALLVPAVPTAVVFEGAPVVEDPMTGALLQLADRLVVRADASVRDRPLDVIHALVRSTPLSATDVGWLEDRAVRQEIASLFDPPRTEHAVSTISSVRIVAPTSRQWSARLLLGWIAAAIGGDTPKRVGDGWTVDAAGRTVSLSCSSESDRAGCTVQIDTDGRTLEVCARDGLHVAVTDEHRVVQKRTDVARAAILARALTSRASDNAFERALAMGRRLV